MMLIADRTNDGALAETAVQQIETPMRRCASGARSHGPHTSGATAKAQAIRDRLKGK